MVLGALLLVSVIFTAYTAQQAIGGHMPADKVAAAGSTIDTIEDATPILQDTMKVSSPSDLILSVTAECSILTALSTQGSDVADSQETDSAEGKIEIWVTIDGRPVPVASDDADQDGRVVFCNQAYQRTVQDTESSDDGHDSERDFIRTRHANAFNWLAIDTGTVYDDPSNGNNILNIQVWARYMDSTAGAGRCRQDTAQPAFATCSEAIVGQRTLIVEPTKLSIHEEVGAVESD